MDIKQNINYPTFDKLKDFLSSSGKQASGLFKENLNSEYKNIYLYGVLKRITDNERKQLNLHGNQDWLIKCYLQSKELELISILVKENSKNAMLNNFIVSINKQTFISFAQFKVYLEEFKKILSRTDLNRFKYEKNADLESNSILDLDLPLVLIENKTESEESWNQFLQNQKEIEELRLDVLYFSNIRDGEIGARTRERITLRYPERMEEFLSLNAEQARVKLSELEKKKKELEEDCSKTYDTIVDKVKNNGLFETRDFLILKKSQYSVPDRSIEACDGCGSVLSLDQFELNNNEGLFCKKCASSIVKKRTKYPRIPDKLLMNFLMCSKFERLSLEITVNGKRIQINKFYKWVGEELIRRNLLYLLPGDEYKGVYFLTKEFKLIDNTRVVGASKMNTYSPAFPILVRVFSLTININRITRMFFPNAIADNIESKIQILDFEKVVFSLFNRNRDSKLGSYQSRLVKGEELLGDASSLGTGKGQIYALGVSRKTIENIIKEIDLVENGKIDFLIADPKGYLGI